MLRINTPLREEDARKLKMGDKVLITGTIFTGRDAAHKRIFEALQRGEELPVNLRGEIIYYVGPCPAKPGEVIGSAGPTTSGRMDPYTPATLKYGLKGMIGKGLRDQGVVEAMKKYGAVYFVAVGGAGALLAERIKKAEVVAYPDLGTEAIHRLEVEDFPVIVAIDAEGNDLYAEGRKKYQKVG
ncbi:MAG: Fe-S-containing hydro-lyase [Firmicutes bacterium]|nr:Fe-S-containing hydro-lyase [Bacillota bacterium]